MAGLNTNDIAILNRYVQREERLAYWNYLDAVSIRETGQHNAYAVLAARTQSEAPPAPGEILVAVLQAGRLFIVSAPAPGVTPIAACDAVTADFARRAAEASDAHQASIPGDNTLAAVADRLREEGEAAFKSCFAAHAKDEAFFRPAIAQAQALADALPAN